jgi:hypothetical protein
MKMHPVDFMGKTIKAIGNYNTWYFAGTGLTYHIITIEGPSGCCPQALEFILHDGDYPEEGARIEITGVFASYDENGGIFYYIAVDNIQIFD